MPRDITEAYLKGEAGDFFASRPSDAAARAHAVRRAARPLAPEIADALVAQNARWAASPARDAHLAALRQGAAAVVTGQQVGLFLGPLYTIYKAASAIVVARALAAETGRPVVPVFWLQTEDHDLPEIAACGVASERGEPRLVQLPASADERVSIAHRLLPDAITGCLAELRAELGGQLQADAHLSRLARHYRPGAGWAEAFAGLLAELFAPEGLVLVDPRDPALARAAAPVHEWALVHAGPIASALAARAQALEAAGFAAPVHVRAGAPLSFFHPEGPTGPRCRLEPEAGAEARFVEVGRTEPRAHTRAALLAALAADPRCFSTSALLRPILQDTWLPTAAYVGGPGELAYFAQLSPLYELYGLPMPLVLLRARFRLIDARTRKLLARLGLTPADAALAEDELLARGPGGQGGAAAEVAPRLLAPFEAALAALEPTLTAAGPELARALARTRGSVARSVGKLAARYQRALSRADGERVAAVRRLKATLQPGGIPQERGYGLPCFAARFGDRELIELVLRAIRPFDPSIQDLEPGVSPP